MSTDKAIWLTGYQTFGVRGITSSPAVADYPLDLKRQVVANVMSNKREVVAQVRAERRDLVRRHESAVLIQRAFRARPTGVDNLIKNKTALGIRP